MRNKITRIYSESEMNDFMQIKKELLGSCKKCSGIGYDGNGEKCECMKLFQYIKELKYSNIPMKYWGLSFYDLEIKNFQEEIKRYYEKLENAISNGVGCSFCSMTRGTGKTSIMATIGKRAIQLGYEVYYCYLQNLLDDKFTEEKIVEQRMKSADIVLIDEFDKAMIKDAESNLRHHIEIVLRNIISNKHPVLVGTNKEIEKMDELYNLSGFLLDTIREFKIEGDNKRIDNGVNWANGLEDQKLYFVNNVIRKESLECKF